MRRTSKKKLQLRPDSVRVLSQFALTRAVGGSGTDNSEGYCPGNSDVNSCVAQCGI
jgi:hypothetical protein